MSISALLEFCVPADMLYSYCKQMTTLAYIKVSLKPHYVRTYVQKLVHKIKLLPTLTPLYNDSKAILHNYQQPNAHKQPVTVAVTINVLNTINLSVCHYKKGKRKGRVFI